jgi:hypothetical protein
LEKHIALLSQEGSVIAQRSHEGWVQSCPYRIEHQFQTFEDQSMFETKHSNIQFTEECIPLPILLASYQRHVLCAVQFDGYAEFRTIKVDNVRTYAVLAPEFLSIELGFLKIFPKNGFSSVGFRRRSERFSKILRLL